MKDTRSTAPVTVHIEELVLHGFAPADRWRIADAVQSELARTIADHGIAQPRAPIDIASLHARPIDIAPSSRAEQIGTSVARALHGALK